VTHGKDMKPEKQLDPHNPNQRGLSESNHTPLGRDLPAYAQKFIESMPVHRHQTKLDYIIRGL
jgi:hypothetical protein